MEVARVSKKKRVQKKVDKKRGISPLIATVLLIGFTIVLAALVMKWGSELFRSTTTTQGCASQARLSCASDVEIELLMTNTSSGDPVVNTFNAIITSKTNRVIDGYWVILYRTDGTTRAETHEYATSIPAFQSVTQALALTDGNLARVEVIPNINYVQTDGTQCPTECSEKSVTFSF